MEPLVDTRTESTVPMYAKVLATCIVTAYHRVTVMKLEDLQRYRQELVSEHESELAAIDRLIARERLKAPPYNLNGHQAQHAPIRSASVGSPNVSAAVKSVLDKIGNGEFTQEHIKAFLNQMGVSMEGWGPRSIGINLWRRARAGELVSVQRGIGGAEAVYKKA